MSFKKKILFLYSELAGYSVSCINNYIDNNPENEVHIIRWPLNSEAPFNFVFHDHVFIHEKNSLDILEYTKKIKPDLVICSGWFDKEYLSVVKKIHGTIHSVLMFDNYWEGSIRQKIGRVILPYSVTKYFDYAWVPGELQGIYARKIGFKESQLFYGFYATDLSKFDSIYQEKLTHKADDYPKQFLYVGRYLTLKGVEDLWTAFEKFSIKNPEWELHCAGTGQLFDSKKIHPRIVHHGFVQPDELRHIAEASGVLVMPSHYDHWGMAVQEFAAAGLPLICSDTVGAASVFLEENKNGFSFKAKDVDNLEEILHKVASLPTQTLLEFGKKSNELSSLYTMETWATTLNEILSK